MIKILPRSYYTAGFVSVKCLFIRVIFKIVHSVLINYPNNAPNIQIKRSIPIPAKNI